MWRFAVRVVGAHGLDQVALRQVGLDQGPLDALAQWFGADGDQGGLTRLGMAADAGEFAARRLQYVEQALAAPLALQQHQVVVSAGQ